MDKIVKWLHKMGASVLFLGYIPVSGTVCSAAVVVGLWFLLTRTTFFALPNHDLLYWMLCLAATGVSFFLASGSKELFGKEDSGRIVIDELAGQLLTFLFVPLSARTLIAGFFLFRLYDIVKPYPVYYMEELEDGIGVTMDDVAAGVYANVSLLLLLMVYHAIKSYIA